MTELEKQSLINAFEYTYELAWNPLKDFLTHRGQVDIYESRDASRKAFTFGLIYDGEGSMDMLQRRNQTSPTYNEETADEITIAVMTRHYPLFKQLRKKLTTLLQEQDHPA